MELTKPQECPNTLEEAENGGGATSLFSSWWNYIWNCHEFGYTVYPYFLEPKSWEACQPWPWIWLCSNKRWHRSVPLCATLGHQNGIVAIDFACVYVPYESIWPM
jgi:hypothetical protein